MVSKQQKSVNSGDLSVPFVTLSGNGCENTFSVEEEASAFGHCCLFSSVTVILKSFPTVPRR